MSFGLASPIQRYRILTFGLAPTAEFSERAGMQLAAVTLVARSALIPPAPTIGRHFWPFLRVRLPGRALDLLSGFARRSHY